MKEKCPCEGCIVITFCRLKYFDEFMYCQEVSKYLGFEGKPDQQFPIKSEKHMKNYPKFYKTLNPVKWKYKNWPFGHERRGKDFQIIKRKKAIDKEGQKSWGSKA